MKANCRLNLHTFSSGGGKEPNRWKPQKKNADTERWWSRSITEAE